jgi:hypothetical protein
MPDPAATGWRALAVDTRAALELLGYGVPRCLPGEPEACGGDDAEHALAHLAALAAVVDFRLGHLGPGSEPLVAMIRGRVAAELEAGGDCDQGHRHGG